MGREEFARENEVEIGAGDAPEVNRRRVQRLLHHHALVREHKASPLLVPLLPSEQTNKRRDTAPLQGRESPSVKVCLPMQRLDGSLAARKLANDVRVTVPAPIDGQCTPVHLGVALVQEVRDVDRVPGVLQISGWRVDRFERVDGGKT